MTSIFSEEGKNIPCTILEVGPCKVTQIKSEEKDGYSAVQLGYLEQKESRVFQSVKRTFFKSKNTSFEKIN